MRISGGVDPAEVRRVISALETYRRATGKDLEDTINRFMRNVAIYAIAKTPIAKRDGIERELTQIVTTTRSGRNRRRPLRIANTRARAIYVRNLRRRGIDPSSTSPGDISKGVDQMIKSRLRGVGYHRAGWIPALRKFGAPLLQGGAKQFGPAKGTASKATELRLRAEISNFAGAIDKVGRPAFDQAIREARVDMMTYARKRLAQRATETTKKLR